MGSRLYAARAQKYPTSAIATHQPVATMALWPIGVPSRSPRNVSRIWPQGLWTDPNTTGFDPNGERRPPLHPTHPAWYAPLTVSLGTRFRLAVQVCDSTLN